MPIFIFSCIPFLEGEKYLSSIVKHCQYAFAISVLTVVTALWQSTDLVNSPASSLRPLEILASSGGFLLIAIINSCFSSITIGGPKKLYAIYLRLSLALLVISLACFREDSATVLSLISSRHSRYLFCLLCGVLAVPNRLFRSSALAMTIIVDFRFLF